MPRTGGDNKRKGWCFTCFDGEKIVFRGDLMEYMVVGKETCPDTGRLHWQGFVYFINRKRFNDCRNVLPAGTHIEPQRGTFREADEYCKKDGDFQVYGTAPAETGSAGGQGKKRAYDVCVALSKSGDFEQLPDWYVACHLKNAVFINSFYRTRDPPKDLPPSTVSGIWIHGPPGVGKSHLVRATYTGIYLKMCNKWWDGYSGQRVVLLEDLDMAAGKWIGYFLKIWGDRYAFPCEYKGGSTVIRPDLFVITSNYSIRDIFGDDIMLQEAIKRRFPELELTSRAECIGATLPTLPNGSSEVLQEAETGGQALQASSSPAPCSSSSPD